RSAQRDELGARHVGAGELVLVGDHGQPHDRWAIGMDPRDHPAKARRQLAAHDQRVEQVLELASGVGVATQAVGEALELVGELGRNRWQGVGHRTNVADRDRDRAISLTRALDIPHTSMAGARFRYAERRRTYETAAVLALERVLASKRGLWTHSSTTRMR